MSIWDDRILEYLVDEGPAPPSEVTKHENIHVTRSHVSKRMAILREKGLLDGLGNGVHQINKKGRLYLAGRWDAQREDYVPNYNPSDGIQNTDDMIIESQTKIGELREMGDEK